MQAHHQAMWAYVQALFAAHGNIADPRRPYRDKAAHTLRVLAWVERIAPAEGGDLELLTTCTLFHDVGYTVDPANHPAESARICDRYLLEQGASAAYRQQAREIILHHGDKGRLTPDTPLNELILIEADNLEEKGAMDILWDVMDEAVGPATSYEGICRRICRQCRHRRPNIMVTATARRLWQERVELMEAFARSLALELNMEAEL